MTTSTAHLRIARPTDDIEALLPFYCNGLGFKVLLRFKEHDGFDGVMLGPPGANAAYHLEFTSKAGHTAGKAPTQDNLLVFYLPESDVYYAATLRMKEEGFEPVASFNPYWDKFGMTFQDADGYRVVLANLAAPLGRPGA
ncbi:hypothetical protein E4U43_004513 [Claviceps pusilla]|uniref:VOC domain-containing protein n=1 Tax=Claviceps pusilla TaxID=123648 RepID=A0A9P7SW29_9HYPO|nr:hypothetical protein E4U43_004513 [Claviceps pusilla]